MLLKKVIERSERGELMEYIRFELKDDTKENRDKFERLLDEKNLSREDLVFIDDQVRLSNDLLKNQVIS